MCLKESCVWNATALLLPADRIRRAPQLGVTHLCSGAEKTHMSESGHLALIAYKGRRPGRILEGDDHYSVRE